MALIDPKNPDNIFVVDKETGRVSTLPKEDAIFLDDPKLAKESSIAYADVNTLARHFREEEDRKLVDTSAQEFAGAAYSAASGIAPIPLETILGKTSGLFGKDKEDNFKEWLKMQREVNPDINNAAELLGMVGGSLVGGGAIGKGVAKAATALPKVAGKAAQFAAKAPKVAELASAASREATIGIAQSAVNEIDKGYIESKPVEWGEIITNGIFSGAIGAGLSRPAYAVGKAAFKKVTDKPIEILDKAIDKYASPGIKKLYSKYSAARIGQGVSSQDVEQVLTQSRAYLPDTAGGTFRPSNETYSEVVKRIFELDAKQTQLLSQVSGRLQDYKESRIKAKIGREAETKLKTVYGVSSQDIAKLENKFVQNNNLINTAITNLLNNMPPNYPTTMSSDILDFVRSWNSLTNIPKKDWLDYVKNPSAASNALIKQIHDEYLKKGGNLHNIFTQSQVSSPNRYAKVFIDMLDENEVIRDIVSKKNIIDSIPLPIQAELGIPELLAGGAAAAAASGFAPVILPAAYAGAKLMSYGKNPIKDMSRFRAIGNARRIVRDEVDLFMKHAALPAAEKLQLSRTVQTYNMNEKERAKYLEKQQKEGEAVAAMINEMQTQKANPNIAMEDINNSLNNIDMLNELPQTRLEVAAGLMRVSDYLMSITPALRPVDNIDSNNLAIPSKDEIRDFKRAIDSIKHPEKVIRNLALGTATPDTIKALSIAYPSLYRELEFKMRELIASGKATRQQKEYFETMFGILAEETALYQEALGAPLKEEPKRTGGRKQSQGAVDRQVEANKTATQKIQK